MTTSYRIKKAHRESVLNRQRRLAAGIIILTLLLVWILNCGMFSVTTEAAGEESFIYVPVRSGDTIWSIAGEYVPEKTDIRSFVYRIAAENNVDNYLICEGQLLKIPQ